jgi:hypothetical protein
LCHRLQRTRLARRFTLAGERLEPRLALATVQATFTGDNHYGLYAGSADGTRMSGLIGRNEFGDAGSPGTYNWSLPETFSFSSLPDDRLYVVAWDDGLWQSLIGQFKVDGGRTITTNAADWEFVTATFGSSPGIAGNAPPAQRLQEFVATATWQRAADLGGNESGTEP